MAELGEKIIELRLATRRACMCEDGKDGKSTLSLKTKVLYLIGRGAPPKNIMAELIIGKTNLAALTKTLFTDGLIEKRRASDDLRQVFYSLTAAGETYLNNRIERLERSFEAVNDLNRDADEVIELLERATKVLDGKH